jgi:hypothetical protein
MDAWQQATIVMTLCGGVRLAAQQPAVPVVPADTTKAAAAGLVADTVNATPVRADSARTDSAKADATTAYRHVTLAEYMSRVLGPRALLKDLALAGVDQGLKRSTDWPNTWGGYGNRVSSRLGMAAISQAVKLGAAAALDERPAQFTRCRCVGTESRVLHAALVPWTMDSPTGTHRSMIGPASEIGSAILVTSLKRGGFSARDGLLAGATGVLGSSLVSVAREFWPWHRRPPGF